MLSFREARQIPITEYLTGLGFEPARIRGNDHWYHSPFREERTPSFKVNTQLNVWYDHGIGQGGSILDLGAKLHQCSLSEFAEKLSAGNHQGVSLHRQPVQIIAPDSKLEVVAVKELFNIDLLHYLETRGISESIAKTYCKEVDFRIRERTYKAIGFPNNSGAYELRNNWFKGSSSPKDISIIHNGSDKISVLEGFIDFLSLVQSEIGELKSLSQKSDFLILNSLRLLNRSISILQPYKKVTLFLDNDLAAKESKESLKERGVHFDDASTMYRDHKDLNDFHKVTRKLTQGKDLPISRSRRIRR